MADSGSDLDLAPLVRLVARLRAPDGCPWDQRQELSDLRAYLLEEAHEVAAAIDQGDWSEVTEELGDLLFQVAFLGRLAEEAGEPGLSQAIASVYQKMVERHPHVFPQGEAEGAGERLETAEAVREAWERRKARKAREKGEERSLLDGLASSLPALTASYRMTQKAAGVGFDWPDSAGVLEKIEEELEEVKEAVANGQREKVREEVGDLLFTVANLARKVDVDPEGALAATNQKFRRRFRFIEGAMAAKGNPLEEASLEELEAHWQAAKEAGL